MKLFNDLQELQNYENEMIEKGVWNESCKFDVSLVDEEKLCCIIEGHFDDVMYLVNEEDNWYVIVDEYGEVFRSSVDEKEVLYYLMLDMNYKC